MALKTQTRCRSPLSLEETQLTSSPRFLTEHLAFPAGLGVCVNAQRPAAGAHTPWITRQALAPPGHGSSFWRAAGPRAAASAADLSVR